MLVAAMVVMHVLLRQVAAKYIYIAGGKKEKKVVSSSYQVDKTLVGKAKWSSGDGTRQEESMYVRTYVHRISPVFVAQENGR